MSLSSFPPAPCFAIVTCTCTKPCCDGSIQCKALEELPRLGRRGRKLAKMTKPWGFSLCSHFLGYGSALAPRPGRLHEGGQVSSALWPSVPALDASKERATVADPLPWLPDLGVSSMQRTSSKGTGVLANGLGSVVACAISFKGECFCCWSLHQRWMILRQRMTQQTQLFCSSSVVVGATTIALS